MQPDPIRSQAPTEDTRGPAEDVEAHCAKVNFDPAEAARTAEDAEAR